MLQYGRMKPPKPQKRKKPTKRPPPAPSYLQALQRERAPRESWEQVASWYDAVAADQGTEYHRAVILPGLLRLLQLQKGEQALDLGCGQGAVSRALSRAGAEVTGVDLSPRLIAMAKRRFASGIRYLVGDAHGLGFLPDASFDALVCVLVLQNMEPLASVFAECARLLRPGGRLVAVLSHPAFRIPRQSGWVWEVKRRLLYRRVDGYLSERKIPIDMRPFKRPEQEITWTYHRPLQAYVNGLAAAGLVIDVLEEWPSHKVSEPGPRAHAENRARAEFPLFLALRARRLPLGAAKLGKEGGDREGRRSEAKGARQ